MGLSRTTKKNAICVTAVLLLALVVSGGFLWNVRPAKLAAYSKKLDSAVLAESHVLAVGDIYWGREMRQWSDGSPEKTGYPFSRLDEFRPEHYDAWIGNLECPSVPGVNATFKDEKDHLKFNCPVEYLPQAAKWFDVVSLANNHMQNQNRETGLQATRQQLDKNGIQYFGDFNPHIKENVCEVVSLPARVLANGGQQEASLPVAMCGFHGVYYTVTDQSLAVIKDYAKHFPVIVYPHMGQEYQAVADTKRQEIYRKMIDNGADVVLGNHPHWVQPTEVYKGKLIVYSMGNFIFDQQFNAEVMRSAAIDITMQIPRLSMKEDALAAWLKLGAACKAFHDECLDQANEQNLGKLPVTFTYKVVGVDTSNKITKPANQKTTDEILQRMNWSRTAEQLTAANH